jgi:hypothetical protein
MKPSLIFSAILCATSGFANAEIADDDADSTRKTPQSRWDSGWVPQYQAAFMPVRARS